MMSKKIDQGRYNRLADWAQSDAPVIHPSRGISGDAAAAAGADLLRRAGRPSLEESGATSPRRQVRLPESLSKRVDALAEADGRTPSELMREAIADYVDAHENHRAG